MNTTPSTTPTPETGENTPLMGRKERRAIKKSALKTMKRHYGLLILLALIAIMLGSEFSGGALFLHATHTELPGHAGQPESFDTARYSDPGSEVFRDIAMGNVIEGIELSDELQALYENSGGGALGHTEGFLASTIGTVTSGHLYVKVLQAIFTITRSPTLSVVLFVILAALLYSFVFVLVREPYTVIVRRMYQECRLYEKVPFHHIFHVKHARRWVRVSLTVIWADFLYALWFFTIAGAFIKRYSYYLVPYIAAENPDIDPREAVALSRRMMDGHKMECFKLELTFLGWLALGFASFGVINIFFYAPYKLSAMAEYYARVRQQAIEAGIPGTEVLDDTYLFEKADPRLLRETYRDSAKEMEELDKYEIELTGVKRFFAENMALWMGTMEAKERYQEVENRKYRVQGDMEQAGGLAYPDRLNPRLREVPLVERIQTNFIRCYTLWNLGLMFFLFAMIGWLWEVILFIIQTGELVNRGSLHGPWIPIYGAGGALILIVLCRLRTKPLAEFFGIATLCGFVEYLTSYIMEATTGMRWWDYSNYFLNLDGRICAEGLFAFAVLGSALVYFLGPVLDTLLMRVNNKLVRVVTICLAAAFIGDVIYTHYHPHTGKGITDMGEAPGPETFASLPDPLYRK